VAEGITVGDLKGTLEAFLTRLFASDTKVRLRPSYFPFTEPSCEVDISCQLCHGTAARLLGHGLDGDPGRRHGRSARARELRSRPRPLFGLRLRPRLDRVAMNKWGIPNIRSLFESDERLLRRSGAEGERRR